MQLAPKTHTDRIIFVCLLACISLFDFDSLIRHACMVKPHADVLHTHTHTVYRSLTCLLACLLARARMSFINQLLRMSSRLGKNKSNCYFTMRTRARDALIELVRECFPLSLALALFLLLHCFFSLSLSLASGQIPICCLCILYVYPMMSHHW